MNNSPSLSPGQAEYLSTMPGNAYLGLPIDTLDASRDLFPLPLQNDLVARSVGQFVEASSVTTEEILELLLCNVCFRDDATLNGFFETKEDKLHDIWLSEHTRRGLALLSRRLGLQGMGGTVASTLDSLV